jgi:uncharacterized protein
MKLYNSALTNIITPFRVIMIFALFMIRLTPTALAQTSVWKATKNGKLLYLGGTVHVLPAEQYPLPPAFEHAFFASDTLIFEAPLPDPTDVAATSQMMRKMAYTNGETLSTTLKPSTYTNLEQYFSSFGMSASQFDPFKPGFSIMMMSMLEVKKAGLSGEGVDAYFLTKARKERKQISYLETADFQLSLLANMGHGNEDNFINTSIRNNKGFAQKFKHVIASWRSGNDVALQQVILEDAINLDIATYNAFFTDRNKRWLPQIIHAQKNSETIFVLVGAGHLVGPDGLLSLLKNKGYIIEQE